MWSKLKMRHFIREIEQAGRGFARLGAVSAAFLSLAACGGLDRNGQFREDPFQGFEQKVIGGALASAGVIPPQREKIAYTPRAPLALPPPQAAGRLPLPEDATQIAANAPNWPDDPDEARKRRLAQDGAQRQQEIFNDQQRKRLSVEDIEAGRSTRVASNASAQGAPIQNERFDNGKTVVSREELERGWSRPDAGSGFSLFEVDETVDVRDRDRVERTGQAKDYIDQNNGSNSNLDIKLDRVDTSRLANNNAAKRDSIIDPPSTLRAPAPADPNYVPPPATQEDRPWWKALFGG